MSKHLKFRFYEIQTEHVSQNQGLAEFLERLADSFWGIRQRAIHAQSD